MKPFLFSILVLTLATTLRADFNHSLSVPGNVPCGDQYTVSADVEENENWSNVEVWIYKDGAEIAYSSGGRSTSASANETGSASYSAHFTSSNGDDAWDYGDTSCSGGGGGGTPSVTISASTIAITTGQTVGLYVNAQDPGGQVQYINVDRVSHGGYYGTADYADADSPDYGSYWVGGNSGNVTRTLTLIFHSAGTYVFRGATWASGSGWYYSSSDVTITVASGGGGGSGGTTQTFATSGTFTVPSGVTSVAILVVGGGGGGGWHDGDGGGGGGGGGGVVYNPSYAVSPGQQIAVAVGAAGSAGYGVGNWPTNGGNSSFGSITAIGGGGGGNWNHDTGWSGGSGGGGTDFANSPGGASTASQGNAGGAGDRGSYKAAGGGGGATGTGAGGNGGNGIGGNGGAGYTYNGVVYGAGGGGGTDANVGAASGGSGAGNGGTPYVLATSGTNGRGAGGGGSGNDNGNGSNGGSGIVIVTYTGSGGGDTTLPSVSITAPGAGSTVSGSAVTLAANASDNVGVAGVQFKLDGVNLGSEDTTTPYSISWDTTLVANGTHTLTAAARDAAGNTATSSGVQVTVSNSGGGGGYVSATGGSTYSSGNDRIHVFNGSGTLNVSAGGTVAEVLIVGGGGAGGQSYWSGGGGGGGGVRRLTNVSLSTGSYSITVGVGGTVSSANTQTNGGDSAAFGYSAAGGGAGASYGMNFGSGAGIGAAGGNGGGGAQAGSGGGPFSGGSGAAGGFSGGVGYDPGLGTMGGGGGGAGGGGGNSSYSGAYDGAGGNGGAGVSYALGGMTYSVGGGGGGGCDVQNRTQGLGNSFGGGAAGYVGSANTGGGGGGSYASGYYGGSSASAGTGGSGIVVIRYQFQGSGGGDTTAPSVAVTAPSAGASVSGSAVTVSASASDNVGVIGLQFKLDGSNLNSEVTTSPYSTSWNTTGVANGTHTLTATARDAAGNTATATNISVTVANGGGDTTAPSVSMTAPSNGATVAGSTTVSASASDNVGVAGVQFKLNGANLGSEVASAPYSTPWNTTGVANGTYTLTATARDSAGNTATATNISVTVANGGGGDTTLPSVAMTAPSNGATVSGSSVTVLASASDNVGVAGVQFKLDGGNLGAEVTVPPYAYIWSTTGVSNGNHTLAAVARDAAGNNASHSVTVTVSNGSTNAPSFTTQPEPANVAQGANASFTVAVSGSPTPTLQWFISTDAGATWAQLSNDGTYSNVTGVTLGITTPALSMSGYLYRCLASNSVQINISSVPATLTVYPVYSLTVVGGTVGSSGATTMNGLTTGTVVEIHANTPPSNMLFFLWTSSGSGTLLENYSANTNFTVGTQNVTLTATSRVPPSDVAEVDTVNNPFTLPPPYPTGSGTASSGNGSANASYTVTEYYPEIYQYCWWDYVIVDWECDYYWEECYPIYDWVEFCDPAIILFWWETDLFQVSNTIAGLSYSLTVNFDDSSSTTIPFIGNGGTKNVFAYTFGSGADPAPTSSTAERTTNISITGKEAICVGCFANFLITVTPATEVNVVLTGGDLPPAVTGTTGFSTGQAVLSTSWLTPGVKTVTATIAGTSISATRNIEVLPITPPPYTAAWDQFPFIGRVIESHVKTATEPDGWLGYTKPRRRYERTCDCTCLDGSATLDPTQFRYSGYVMITDYWYRSDLLTMNGPAQGVIDRQAIINCEFQHSEIWRQEAENTRAALSGWANTVTNKSNCITVVVPSTDYLVNSYRQLADVQNAALDKDTEPFGPHPRTANQILQGGFRGL